MLFRHTRSCRKGPADQSSYLKPPNDLFLMFLGVLVDALGWMFSLSASMNTSSLLLEVLSGLSWEQVGSASVSRDSSPMTPDVAFSGFEVTKSSIGVCTASFSSGSVS